MHEKYREFKDSFFSENPDAHLDVFDFDEECEFADVQAALYAGEGLFSQKKCIVLKNVFSLNAAKQEDVRKLLEGVGDDESKCIIVAEFLTAKPKGELFKFLNSESDVQVCDELKQGELKSWIKTEIKQRSEGKTSISSEALQRFCEMTGGDMWIINGEIEKLVNYKQEGEISLDDVELLCRGEVDSGIFDLVDAIGTKNKEKAVELKNRLLVQGENEFYVFSMILSQLRNLMKALECLEKGINNTVQISQKCSMHPFVAKKTLAQLRGYNKKQLKNSFLLASEIDQKAKTGDLGMEEALDYLIVKI